MIPTTNEKLLSGSVAQNALASLEKKLQMLRDLVTAVAKGFKTGLFLYGSGGVGKSYNVLRQLEKLEVGYQLFNGRMTAKGLFRAMKAAQSGPTSTGGNTKSSTVSSTNTTLRSS